MAKVRIRGVVVWFLLVAMWCPFTLWALLPAIDLEKLATDVANFYGPRAEKRIRAWRAMVEQNQGEEEYSNLHTVNQFFNQLFFLDDIQLWGANDYWATPVEFLGANGGDCEDFSIAKYFTLLELGIPDEKMRMVYVKAIELDQFHMVVAYYETPSSVPLILDNIDGEIKPATQRPDLLPVYSFNGSHLWLMKERGRGQLAGKASRINLWNELRDRYQSDAMRKPVVDLDG